MKPETVPGTRRPGVMRKTAELVVAAASRTDGGLDPDAPSADRALPITLSILVPVYNEVATLDVFLDRLLTLDLGWEFEVVAVDDASTDGSGEVLAARHHCRLRVLHHSSNRGKGASVQSALDVAAGEIVVVQDADLEYDPLQLHALVGPVVAGEADVVYGSRFLGHARDMRLANRVANKGLTLLTRILFATPITDMETCYKVVRRELLTDMRFEAQRFDLEPEITARLLRRGHHILELPIEYDGRSHAQGKKIGWRDGVAAIRTLLRWRFLRPTA